MEELSREKAIHILKKIDREPFTTRTKIAVECLAGLCANPAIFAWVSQRTQPEQIANRFADLALQHADALIIQLMQPLEERYPEPKSEIVL